MKLLTLSFVGLLFAMGGHAQAATVSLDFSGSGVSGSLVLTYGAATDAKYSNAYEVTGISGTFSDSNNSFGIVNAAVGPLVAVNHAIPEIDNLLAPAEFSRFAVATGLPPENHGTLSFDNLFWPGGSPQAASDYPFHGGVLDIYGLMFSIGGGMIVNFWSNGILPGTTLPNCGVAVASADAALDYVGDVTVSAVPVPASLWLMGGGLFGLMALRRRKSV